MSRAAEESRALSCLARCEELEIANQQYISYIREKTDQLLEIMGGEPLNHEELDDRELLALDPIGIIAESIAQVIGFLESSGKAFQDESAGGLENGPA